MLRTEPELELTIVLTVVSGKDAVRANLKALTPQINFGNAEVIVPYDGPSLDIGDLKSEFPQVEFVFIEDSGANSNLSSTEEHRLYDKRRAVGLRRSRGRIVAMSEDHALPADDWVKQILAVHEQPYDVIGGAVENGIDTPLNRAVYYCDFGRYGRPFENAEAAYVSDVNVSYKRGALLSVQDIWRDAYQETTVHWTLRANGRKLFLDDRPVVYQSRKGIRLGRALYERIGWGRIFAETRVKEISLFSRLLYALGAFLLPVVMLGRVFRHMLRQQRSIGVMLSTLPIASMLLMAWAWGEFLGYVVGPPDSKPVRKNDQFVGKNSLSAEGSKQQ